MADALARAMLGVVVLLVLMTLGPVAFGWRSDVVMTGSMRPVIAPGDVVVSRPAVAAEVRARQIVIVVNPAQPRTTLLHRVVRINEGGSLVTQGDANPVPDSTPVPPDFVRAVPALRIPYIGLPVLWTRTRQYSRIAAFAASVGLLLACLRRSEARPTAKRVRRTGRGRHRAFAAMSAHAPARRPRRPRYGHRS